MDLPLSCVALKLAGGTPTGGLSASVARPRPSEAVAFKPLPKASDQPRLKVPAVVRSETLLALPDSKVQDDLLRQVKESFPAEYRATGTERVAGAVKLMEAGVDMRTEAATAYVLLKETRDMAAAAGDARVALAAARHIAARFSVDLTEMGLAVLQSASRSATTVDRAAEVAQVAMLLLSRAAEAR